MKKEKITVLHAHNSLSLLYGALAAKMARVPLVFFTKHGNVLYKTNFKNKLFYHLALLFADQIIAVSKEIKNSVFSGNGIAFKKTIVVSNGISLDLYDKTDGNPREKIGVFSSAFIIGTVARLSAEKDLFTLLDSFRMASQKINNVKLIIAGDGPMRKELERYTEKLKIKEKVLFLGFQQDIPKILSIFDVFVLSSLTEGMSLALLEAMACKKPIVATNVGGNPEVVVDEVTGILVPPKDPEKMAQAIVRISKNKRLAQKMGKAGRKRVEEEFSLKKMIDEYEKLYEYWLIKRKILRKL